MYKLTQQNLRDNICNFAQKLEAMNSRVTTTMLRDGVDSVMDYYQNVLTCTEKY